LEEDLTTEGKLIKLLLVQVIKVIMMGKDKIIIIIIQAKGDNQGQ